MRGVIVEHSALTVVVVVKLDISLASADPDEHDRIDEEADFASLR
jgi:hypothetical protein